MTPPRALAQRVIAKYKLAPPVEVEELVASYAKIVTRAIPIAGVDGLSLNLKTPGKRPTVVVNADSPPRRRRFTLAHELGHILIPWHMGSFVDSLDLQSSDDSKEYWMLEEEANEFAAELLMPTAWVVALLAGTADLAACHKKVIQRCEVSSHAAAIQMLKHLPSHIVYAVTRDAKVEHSGKTDGTLAPIPHWSEPLPDAPFAYARTHFLSQIENHVLHWWILPDKLELVVEDERDWREILDGIVNDIGVPKAEQARFKSSLNGVIAAANGSLRRLPGYNAEKLAAACLQRLHGREPFLGVVEHPDFNAFVAKKSATLVGGDA